MLCALLLASGCPSGHSAGKGTSMLATYQPSTKPVAGVGIEADVEQDGDCFYALVGGTRHLIVFPAGSYEYNQARGEVILGGKVLRAGKKARFDGEVRSPYTGDIPEGCSADNAVLMGPGTLTE